MRSLSWKLSSISRCRSTGSASKWVMWVGRPVPPSLMRARFFTASSGVISPALTEGADEQPGGDLEQAGGQPHALGRVGQRDGGLQLLRLGAAGAIEIGGGALDERHAFLEDPIELLGTDREPLGKRHSVGAQLRDLGRNKLDAHCTKRPQQSLVSVAVRLADAS